MKRSKAFIAILATTIFGSSVAIASSLAWMSATAFMEREHNPINGIVEDAYYASGVGTEGDPFIITRPRHLYNLAWLQYLGYYNKANDHQYYFELGDNIEMGDYGAIPPIGTEDNPFVGNFNGNGYVISNVTISNSFGEYVSHPSVISGWDPENNRNQPHILGLFGVIGDYTGGNKPTSYSSAVNAFVNTGITGATIKTELKDSLMGVAAGYVSGNMSNILVDASTIDIDTNITGTTSSYGGYTQNISDYTLVGYTENVAEVKKAEESIYDIEVTSGITFNASEDGDDEGWGGSINMKTIYYRLYAFKKNKTSNVESSFDWKEQRYYYNDVENENERDGTNTLTAVSKDSGNTPHMQRFVGANQSGHEFIGNYNFFHRKDSLKNSTTYSTTDQSYLYLCGGHYEERKYYSSNTHTGRPITDGSGHYFSVTNYSTASSSDNAGTIGNTDSTNATLWSVPTSGDGYISTTYCYTNGTSTTYYVYIYNNTTIRLSTSTSSRTTFTYSKDATSGKIRYVAGDYYLTYSNGNWVMARTPTAPNPTTSNSYLSNGYQISYNGNYLARSNNTTTSVTSGISAANNYGWRFESTSNNSDVTIANGITVRIYCMVSGSNTKYYIRDNGSQSDKWKVSLSNSRQNGATFTVTSAGNDVYYFADSDGYNFVCDTSAATPIYSVRTANDSNSLYKQLTVKLTTTVLSEYSTQVANTYSIQENDSTSKTGPDYTQTSADTTKETNNSHMYFTNQDTTYFPLNVNSDISEPITAAATVNTAISNGDLDPKDSNTGYIVSGSDLVDKTQYTMNQSSIRVSEYTITNIDESFDVSPNASSTIADLPDSTVYTFNTSGAETNMGAVNYNADNSIYPRYSESKVSFYNNSLTTTTTNNGVTSTTANANVYGLHFMTSKISMDSIVNGSKVSILGNNCDNYQLPVNCVDFNLKQKGVINFFAGTYFSDNDSFFSLYQVIRNNDASQKTDGSGALVSGEYNSYKTISDIKEIVAVYSNDVGSKTTKYSNIYKYKKIVNGNAVYTYSEPYRFDGSQNKFKMNKNSTADSQEAYVDNYEMSQSDFNAYVNTYGYTQRLDSAKQLGKQNSAYTSNRIYYFEFPMNAGEYCLGSVDGGTGAYLLYLDIGANASKTHRTIFYEHFALTEKTYSYPAGVALQDLGDDQTTYESKTVILDLNPEHFDASNSACMRILATSKGTYKIERDDDDVTLTRTNAANAPPVYASDSVDKVHESGSSTGIVVTPISSHVYDVRRMEYYDYNVNLEYLTVTSFSDFSDAGGDYVRTTVVQTVYAGNSTSANVTATYRYDTTLATPVDQRSDMKIYSSGSGVKYDVDDIIDITAIVIDDSKISDDLLVTFSFLQDNGSTYEDNTGVLAHVDGTNISGTYYVADHMVISFVPVSGSTITIKVVSLETGAVIYYGNVQITGAGQIITIP